MSARIAEAVALLGTACSALGALDMLVARALRRALHLRAADANRSRGCDVRRGPYLTLLAALGERERPYAPLALTLEGVGIVTGPNMGGKTAALRTLGFMVACVALGVPVPAVRASLPLVDDIAWLGLGALPEDDGLLSAFGTQVVELDTYLSRRPVRALALKDEFARTTSPGEGRALLVALVEALRARGAFGLAATHFGGIAASAAAPHYAVGGVREFSQASAVPLDLRAALERIARATDYRLARVNEDALPHADALELARALGLDAALLSRAHTILNDA